MRARLVVVAALAGALIVAVLSPSAAAITPGASLDQSQDTIEGCAQFSTGVVIGQVFTAGVNGRLTDILLTLGNSSGATDPLRVQLTRVDGSGFPDLTAVIGSAVLRLFGCSDTGAGTGRASFR